MNFEWEETKAAAPSQTQGVFRRGDTVFEDDLSLTAHDPDHSVGEHHGPDAGVFEALRVPAFFAKAYLDCGAVTWPNGADLAPDEMHKEIRRSGMYRILD